MSSGQVPHWLQRVPRSLYQAWYAADELLHAWFDVNCDLDVHEFYGDPASFAYHCWILKKGIDKLKKPLELVNDEFSAIARKIYRWRNQPGAIQDCYANSLELVADVSRLWLRFVESAVWEREPPPLNRDRYEAELAKHIDAVRQKFEKVRRLRIDWAAELSASMLQELCRAANRRLVTKQTYPGDEKSVTDDKVKDFRRRHAKSVFMPTDLQKAILEALDGRALKKEQLAAECRVEPRRLYKSGGIKELRASGMVDHKEGVGYYLPDKPPPDAIEIRPPENGPQSAPN